ncbi:MAG: glycerophosphodiester phosphodiesterase [Actinomycetota bacterium]|nr:glycerophosphodiester phosphodiesterase [Actinomycetota bacterium]
MTLVLAHQGASAVRLGNTIEAFVEARRLGADGVELDARRTADGAVVVHHDPVLADGRAVAGVACTELPSWVPHLDAALEACEDMVVNIEVKDLPSEPGFDPSEPTARAVAALVGERRAHQRTVVSSFAMAAIDAVRSADPGVATAWLTLPAYDQRQALAAASDGGHTALHPHHHGVTPELVTAVHDVGLVVTAWTVDEPERIRWLADAGVDAVITTVPDLARAALSEGGR